MVETLGQLLLRKKAHHITIRMRNLFKFFLNIYYRRKTDSLPPDPGCFFPHTKFIQHLFYVGRNFCFRKETRTRRNMLSLLIRLVLLSYLKLMQEMVRVSRFLLHLSHKQKHFVLGIVSQHNNLSGTSKPEKS